MPAIMALQLSNVAGMARSYDIIELSRLKWEAQLNKTAATAMQRFARVIHKTLHRLHFIVNASTPDR